VAVQVFGPKIVWIAGPEAGSVHDIEVLQKNGLVHGLGESKVLLGDLGYVGEIAVVTPDDIWPTGSRIFSVVRGKVERTINPLKSFKCLSTFWRHDIRKHYKVFKIIAHIHNIVESMMQNDQSYCSILKTFLD
jgi:hypothetical protein